MAYHEMVLINVASIHGKENQRNTVERCNCPPEAVEYSHNKPIFMILGLGKIHTNPPSSE